MTIFATILAILAVVLALLALVSQTGSNIKAARDNEAMLKALEELAERDNAVLKASAKYTKEHMDGRILEILQIVPTERLPQA